MSEPRAQLCPFCRGLNSAGERQCYRCGRPLPGPLASGAIGFFRNAVSGEVPITRALLGLCVLVCALCVASDRKLPIWISDQFSLSTAVRFGGLLGPLGRLEPWRYLAAVFVHANVLHIAMNGWALTSVGPAAERQFGSARFVVLFMLSGILGFVASDQWYGGSGPPTVGASGAIFGAFGSVIGVAYARRDPNRKQILIQNVVNLAILGLVFPVNNAAHVGGLVSGALLGFLFSKEKRELKLGGLFVGLAVVLFVLAPVSIVLSNASPIWRTLRVQELNR
jgi:membrane associated rhomboid family serine protease